VDNQQDQEARWAEARAIVLKMAANGVPMEAIGWFLTPPIKDGATLKRHFAPELEIGRIRADSAVAAVAFQMATSGHHEAMTRWWLSRRVPGFGKGDASQPGPVVIQMIPAADPV
jgi:hypothetical protein